MNTVCSKCGHEATEGEMFVIFVDPQSEWWLQLFDSPQYCKKCAEEVKCLSHQ